MSPKTVQGTKPERPYLRIDHTGELSPDVQFSVNDLHHDAIAWEMNEAARAAKLDGLVVAAQSDSTTIGGARKSAREWSKMRDNQLRACEKLQWRRFHILKEIIPDARKTVEQRASELETLLAAKIVEHTANGALFGMPGGNTDLGRHQLRSKLLQNDIEVVSAKGRLNIAQDELSAAEANALIPPSRKVFDYALPQTGVEMADLILRQEATSIDEPELPPVVAAIREAIGLKGAPLTPEHAETLRAIQTTIGLADCGNGTNPANFRRLSSSVANKVADLLEQLPQTAPRNSTIQDCRNHNRDDRHMNASKPRTAYFDQPAEMVGVN